MTSTLPLRAVYSNGHDTEAIENLPAPDGAVNGHAPETPSNGAARPAPKRGELGAVIDEFMQGAEAGEVRDAYGEQYTADSLRELHSALSHVNSELGTMQIGAVRRWQVQGMLDELRGAGLAPGRLTAVVESLHALYGYAIERGLVDDTPVIWLTFPQQPSGSRPPVLPTYAPPPQQVAPPAAAPAPTPMQAAPATPTPTHAMLALGGRMLLWTMRATVTLFVLVVIVIIVGFA